DVMALVEQFGARHPPAGLFNAVRNRIEAGDLVRERPAWWSWLYSRPARVLAMGTAVAALAFALFLPAGGPNGAGVPAPIPINDAGPSGPPSTALAGSIRQRITMKGPQGNRIEVEAEVLTSRDGRMRIDYLTPPLKGVTIWETGDRTYRFNPALKRLTVAK